MYVISNAFSINMLTDKVKVDFTPHSIEELKVIIHKDNYKSIVGHAETAQIFSKELELFIAMNRTTYSIQPEDTLVVGQYSGPRLEEGATSLPENATINWWVCKILD